MNTLELENILKDHSLRITETRKRVLDYIINSSSAVGQKDIESHFKEFDKVTIYRTLSSFTQKGIIHKIGDENGSVSYGLCYDTCNTNSHQHNHLHFKCNKCGEVRCLEDVVPFLTLPKGYVLEDSNLLLTGICSDCNNS